jgi:hypothetical protein
MCCEKALLSLSLILPVDVIAVSSVPSRRSNAGKGRG